MAALPNVLLICVDHWPGSLLGVMGNSHILTPTLNQLAESGVLFTRAYSATPICIPARRTLMTGTTAKTHGDRNFNERLEMNPSLKTMPQTFRDAGYQAHAVGKLHVYPQRNRIGFDDVILNEEGRHHLEDQKDDFELFLEREGFPGQECTHGMGNNQYYTRSWHLPEHTHPTNWTTREMCRVIQRRDPTRPGFWYCSYVTPHPPIVPLREYVDLYRDIGVDEPFVGEWAKDFDHLPHALKIHRRNKIGRVNETETRLARMAFYATCTHIDHQIRLLIGTLREEGLLDNTIVMFTSDHGDLLGNHGLWAKPPMLDPSNRIPLIMMPTAAYDRAGHHQRDDRLAELCDVMPTLLDLCGIPIPNTVEGNSLVSNKRRDHLYGEVWEDERAMRMIRDDRYKLIWYPTGNRFHLFDMQEDPCEMNDLSADPKHQSVLGRLSSLLVANLYGNDDRWVRDGKLIGAPDVEFKIKPNRTLSNQRGWR